jgi:hypothetical protein
MLYKFISRISFRGRGGASTGRRVLLAALPAFLLAFFLLAVFAFSGVKDPGFGPLLEKKGEPAKKLVESPTLYREKDLKGLPCGATDFEFLLDRPRSSVALAGKLHKSLEKYQIDVVGPGLFHVDDEKSLVGDMELVYEAPGRRIYYVTGYWKLLPGMKLKGRMALVVEYAEHDSGGARSLDCRTRGYMAVDNSLAGVAFKLFAYMFPKKVDKRIDRFATAVTKVVQAINDDPADACARLEHARHVPPEEVREFRDRFVLHKA